MDRIKYALSILIIGLGLLAGCDSTNAEEKPLLDVVDVDMTPNNVIIEEGENIQFAVHAITANGDRIPISDLPRGYSKLWFTSHSTVLTVNNSGFATAQDTGKTVCWIILAGPDTDTKAKAIPFALSTALKAANKSPSLPGISLIRPITFDSVWTTVNPPVGFKSNQNTTQ